MRPLFGLSIRGLIDDSDNIEANNTRQRKGKTMSKLYSTMFCGPQTTPEQKAALENDATTKKADAATKQQLSGMSDVEKWELFKRMTDGK